MHGYHDKGPATHLRLWGQLFYTALFHEHNTTMVEDMVADYLRQMPFMKNPHDRLNTDTGTYILVNTAESHCAR